METQTGQYHLSRNRSASVCSYFSSDASWEVVASLRGTGCSPIDQGNKRTLATLLQTAKLTKT